MSHQKRPLEHIRTNYTVRFSPDQQRVLSKIMLENNIGFSRLLDAALANYIPYAYQEAWPSVHRLQSVPPVRPSRTRTYGAMFGVTQDAVLRRLMRMHHVRFSEMVEKALAHYISTTYRVGWPSSPRLSLLG